jgi:hypothetical protein
MLGLDPGHVDLASFWTDQYGIRINYLGRAPLADGLTIEGDLEKPDFAATYTRAGDLVAALLINRARSVPALRKLLTSGATTP